MRQYLVVLLGVLVLVVGMVAKSYLDKQVPIDTPGGRVARAGALLAEALEVVKPADHATLEPKFAALADACAAPGAAATPAAKLVCERGAALRTSAKAGTSTQEGAGEVQLAMEQLERALSPARP